MKETELYPRYAERRLRESLEDSPVVLIHGPRQCGKTTLARMACAPAVPLTESGDRIVTESGERIAVAGGGFTYFHLRRRCSA